MTMQESHIPPEQRQTLAKEIAESRLELENLARQISLGASVDFERDVKMALIGLQRELRAMVVQIWHRLNAETNWQCELRAPLKIGDLPGLLQSGITEQVEKLEVDPLFKVTASPLPGLTDDLFPDGTALELKVVNTDTQASPVAHLAVTLVPTKRYLVLLGGYVLSRRDSDEEWPKIQQTHSKIGPPRANQWGKMQVAGFLKKLLEDFHAAVESEVLSRRA